MRHQDAIADLNDTGLARRLRGMEIALPSSLQGAAAAGVQPRRRPARRRRVAMRSVLAVAGVAVLCLATGAASYYDPSFAHALADAPGIGFISAPALNAAGLSAGELEPLHDSGSVAGVTATLWGGYDDALQTTLFVDVEGIVPLLVHGGNATTAQLAAVRSVSAMTLTDQFGTTYALTGGEGLGVGPYPAIFQPLRGAAAAVGARLTLSLPVVDGLNHQLGTIQLHATLLPPTAATDIAPPAPVSVAGTTYRIADMHVSENAIEVHTTMSGALINQDVAAMQQLPPPGGVGIGVCFPGVFLVDASGTYEIPIAEPESPNSNNELSSQRVLDETRIFARTQPGAYRIVVSGGGCTSAPPAQEPVLASWSFSG